MKTTPSIKVDQELRTATFTLATGESITVGFLDHMGVEGYGVLVSASRLLTILPRSSNTAELTTPITAIALEQRLEQIAAERKPSRR